MGQVHPPQLLSYLKSLPSPLLPTIAELSTVFGVSTKTMGNAVRALVDAGHIAAGRGRRIAWKGAPNVGRAVVRVEEWIRGNVATGQFRAGESLPKFETLRVKLSVSRSTLSAALRSLERAGVVHKHGRAWHAGPAQLTQEKPPAGSSGASSRVILLLVPRIDDWLLVFSSGFWVPFVQMLKAEAARRAIHLAMVLKHSPPTVPAFVPAGVEQAEEAARKLGERYLGAIMIDPFLDEESFPLWVAALSLHGKRPLVYFDATGSRAAFGREALGLGKHFFRMFLDEEAAVTVALRRLHDAGHRIVGMPMPSTHSDPWMLRRRDTAMQVAQRLGKGLSVIPVEYSEPFWGHLDLSDPDQVTAFAARLRHVAAPAGAGAPDTRSVRATRAVLRSRTPSMETLLRSGATALLSLNDLLACQHYLWCGAAGIDVPRQLSIVAFDNSPEFEAIPITTIDFGFAQLGYLAAHLLIRDIPLRLAADGEVPGPCTLIERGSVGSAASAGA